MYGMLFAVSIVMVSLSSACYGLDGWRVDAAHRQVVASSDLRTSDKYNGWTLGKSPVIGVPTRYVKLDSSRPVVMSKAEQMVADLALSGNTSRDYRRNDDWTWRESTQEEKDAWDTAQPNPNDPVVFSGPVQAPYVVVLSDTNAVPYALRLTDDGIVYAYPTHTRGPHEDALGKIRSVKDRIGSDADVEWYFAQKDPDALKGQDRKRYETIQVRLVRAAIEIVFPQYRK